jgi:hypothetical protein
MRVPERVCTKLTPSIPKFSLLVSAQPAQVQERVRLRTRKRVSAGTPSRLAGVINLRDPVMKVHQWAGQKMQQKTEHGRGAKTP